MCFYNLRLLLLSSFLFSCSTFRYGPVAEVEFKSSIQGKIIFEQIDKSIKVYGVINGLQKFEKYSFRIVDQDNCLDAKIDINPNRQVNAKSKTSKSTFLESSELIYSDQVGRAEINSILHLNSANFELKNVLGKIFVLYPAVELLNPDDQNNLYKESQCAKLIERNFPLQIKADELFAINRI